ncbi:MAG: hypothetical protein ACLQBD_08670 [Syntrophobacteraceae bacterium]
MEAKYPLSQVANCDQHHYVKKTNQAFNGTLKEGLLVGKELQKGRGLRHFGESRNPGLFRTFWFLKEKAE